MTLCNIFFSSWSKHTAKVVFPVPLTCTLSTLTSVMLSCWKMKKQSKTKPSAIFNCDTWIFFNMRVKKWVKIFTVWFQFVQHALLILEHLFLFESLRMFCRVKNVLLQCSTTTNHTQRMKSHLTHLVVAFLALAVLSLQDFRHCELQALHLWVWQKMLQLSYVTVNGNYHIMESLHKVNDHNASTVQWLIDEVASGWNQPSSSGFLHALIRFTEVQTLFSLFHLLLPLITTWKRVNLYCIATLH